MYRLISTYSLLKPPKGSNISGGEILDVLLNIKDITDADERWEQWTGQIDTIIDKVGNCDGLLHAATLLEDHDYFKCTTSEYVLTYISGFVARKTSRFILFGGKSPCEDCKSSLLLNPSEKIPESHKLIQLKSYGYLKHPSKDLFRLISLLEQATLTAIANKDLNAETLYEITNAVESLPSTPLIGCKEHAKSVTYRVITFYLTMRMYFLCKQANKNDSVEKEKTRENRKLAKLTYSAVGSVKSKNNSEVSSNYKPSVPKITAARARKMKPKVLSDSNRIISNTTHARKIKADVHEDNKENYN